MRNILDNPLSAAEIADFKRLTVGIMVSGGIITLSGFILFLRVPGLAGDDDSVTAVTISFLAFWVMVGGIVIGSIGKRVLEGK